MWRTHRGESVLGAAHKAVSDFVVLTHFERFGCLALRTNRSRTS